MPNLNKKLHLAVCSAVVMLAASPLHVLHAAQPELPSAGQILQQIERDAIIQQLPVQPDLEEAAPQPEDQGPKVVVNQFKFEGNQVISAAELEGALEGLIGQPISITELKGAVDLIAAFYREKGFLATATLPEQDITEGVVTINILEALFGDLKVDGEYGKDYKRVRPSVIERAIGLKSYKSKVLNQNKIDQGIVNANALAGVKVQAALQAGAVVGTSDLVVKVQDTPLLSSYISVDNTGGRQTGREKLTTFFTLSSPFGFGETLSLTALKSEGTEYARTAAMVPVGSAGLMLGFNASYLEYDVVTLEFKSQKLSGYSSNFGLQAQYPIFKNKTSSLKFGAEAEKKYFVNKSLAAGKESDYDLQVYSLSLNADHADNWLAGAQNVAGLNLGFGDVNLNGSANEVRDKDGVHTQGSYTRLRWNISRNQFLTDTVSLSISGSGQFANTNLDPSERFYLGGINGVRAYPTSEGAGSDGYLYVAELRKYLPNNLSISTFIDHGHVRQFDDNRQRSDGAEIVEKNSFSLKGYGLSLNWQGPYNSNFKATYARRMGSNPNALVNGRDQDGSRNYDVFWLSGSLAF
jgi:hemolysin activation/secretion protein